MNLIKYDNVKKFINKNYILLSLCFLTVFIKLCFLNMVSTNGDPAQYWAAAKSIFSQLGYAHLKHHTVRFSIIIPVFITQLIFGKGPFVYFISGMIFNVIQIIFMYKIGVKLFNKKITVLSILFFIIQPLMFIDPYGYNVHIYPSVYSITYILIMFYYLLKFMDDESQKKYLVISSIFLFIAYLAKIENVFFMLPIFILLRKNIKDFIIFALVCAGFYFTETILYIVFTDFNLGRIGVILYSHLSQVDLGKSNNFLYIFRRLYRIKMPHLFIFISFYASSIYLFIKKQNKIYPLIIMVWGFLLPITFALKKIHPVQIALPFNTRYLNVVIPFISFILIYSLSFFVSIVKKYDFNKWLQNDDQINKKIKYVYFSLILVCCLFFGINYKNNNYKKIYSYNNLIDHAYESNIPILLHKGMNSFKGAAVARDIFIDDVDAVFSKYEAVKLNGNTIVYLDYNKSQTDVVKNLNDDSEIVVVAQTPFKVKKMKFSEFFHGKYRL